MARAPRRVETARRCGAARDFKKPGTWTRRRDKRARVIPGRIKHHLVPFQIDQPGRGRNALPEFASAAGRGKPELQLDPADALRHIRMQRVPVGQIAASGDDAGRCRRFPRRPHWPADRGRMLTGNPLRAVRRQRTGPHRNGFAHAKNLAWRIGQVDMQHRCAAGAGRLREPGIRLHRAGILGAHVGRSLRSRVAG